MHAWVMPKTLSMISSDTECQPLSRKLHELKTNHVALPVPSCCSTCCRAGHLAPPDSDTQSARNTVFLRSQLAHNFAIYHLYVSFRMCFPFFSFFFWRGGGPGSQSQGASCFCGYASGIRFFISKFAPHGMAANMGRLRLCPVSCINTARNFVRHKKGPSL